MGRNSRLLRGPRSLKGVALVQLSQHAWYLVRTRVLADTTKCAIYSTHKKFCFHHVRIQHYMLFYLHHINGDVILHPCTHVAHGQQQYVTL